MGHSALCGTTQTAFTGAPLVHVQLACLNALAILMFHYVDMGRLSAQCYPLSCSDTLIRPLTPAVYRMLGTYIHHGPAERVSEWMECSVEKMADPKDGSDRVEDAMMGG